MGTWGSQIDCHFRRLKIELWKIPVTIVSYFQPSKMKLVRVWPKITSNVASGVQSHLVDCLTDYNPVCGSCCEGESILPIVSPWTLFYGFSFYRPPLIQSVTVRCDPWPNQKHGRVDEIDHNKNEVTKDHKLYSKWKTFLHPPKMPKSNLSIFEFLAILSNRQRSRDQKF